LTSPELLREDNAGKGSAAAVIATPLALSIVGAFILGTCEVIAFRFIPKFMVYSVVTVKILTPIVAGVVYLSMAGKVCETDDNGYEVCVSPPSWPAFVCFGIGALIAFYFWYFRTALALVVRLFQESSIAIQHNWTLIPVGGFIVLTGILVKALMLAGAAFFIMHMKIVPPLTGTNGQPCQSELSGSAEALIAFTSFVAGWWLLWTKQTKVYIVGDAVGCWYWHGQADKGSNVLRATKHAFMTHLGSNAFAALVVAFVEWLKKKVKSKWSGNPIICLIKLCILCILSYLEYLCQMSTIVVGITGQSFIGSGSTVIRLFTASFGNMKLAAGVWKFPKMILNFFCLLLSLIWGGLTGYITYAAVNKSGSIDHATRGGTPVPKFTGGCVDFYATFGMDKWESASACSIDTSCISDTDSFNAACDSVSLILGVVMGLLALIIVFYLLKFFSGVLEAVIDTIFMCFLIDMEKGIVTKPKIHAVLGEVIRSKSKTQLIAVSVNGGGGNTTVVTQGGGGAGTTVVVHQQPPMAQHQQQQMMAPPPQYNQQPAPVQYAQQPAPVQQQARFCNNCGQPAPPGGGKFCNSCGSAF